MRPHHVEAPTHLSVSGRLPPPPEFLGDEDISVSGPEIVTSAVQGGRRPSANSYHSFSVPPLAAYPPRETTERSDSARVMAPLPEYVPPAASGGRVRTQSSSTPLPEPPREAKAERKKDKEKDRERRKTEAPKSEHRSERKSRSEKKSERKSESERKSKPAAEAAPAPTAPTPDARASAPAIAEIAPGVNAIDPLAVPVPPELGPSLYSWVRRLALQADLAGADRVLRDALLELSSSLACTIVYPGADGLWSLGGDDEIPKDAQPLIAVATARRAIVSSHSAIIPILTSTECVAVITMTRNPRNPAYHPLEQLAMIALAREAAAILHHLAVAHLQKQSEIEADKGGLYRGEALEAHRSRGNEGVPVHLTPSWVKRTYPVLGISLLIAIIVASVVSVPTYSSGFGIVQFPATPVTSPVQGAVDKVLVEAGSEVKKGQALILLVSAQEEAELTQATTEYTNALNSYLLDRADENAKKAVVAAETRKDRAKAQLDTRTIRAKADGTVSDTRVKPGQNLNPGDPILSIIKPGTEPELITFLPGGDRPRLRNGMDLQTDLGISGYKKIREHAVIYDIGREAIGASEAARYLGPSQAEFVEQLKSRPSWVIVKAKLPGATFETEHRKFRYTHGMMVVNEVKTSSKPFLVTLLPALEKYFPD